jgi:hypothetical protein
MRIDAALTRLAERYLPPIGPIIVQRMSSPQSHDTRAAPPP